MTTLQIPLTTYAVRKKKPNNRYGSPARLQVKANESQIFARVPTDKIPLDAVVTSAVIRIFSHGNTGSSRNVRVTDVTGSWNASIRWKTRPDTGVVLSTVTKATSSPGTPWDLNVTSWAVGRERRGLMIDSTTSGHWLKGSSAPEDQPYLLVDYYVPAEQPGNLAPNGGSVSVAAPTLAYEGSDDMTMQKIDFSLDGLVVSSTTGWVASTQGRFDPSGSTPVLTNGGTGIYWRATTRGPTGDSAPSEWAWYDYKALPTVTVTSPGATTPDGSPPLQWTVAGGNQTSWKATLYSGSKGLDESKWANEPATRDWTPGVGVPVPDGYGFFLLQVQDDVPNRVAAVGAPVQQVIKHEFTTTLTGSGTAVDTLTHSYAAPIHTLSGTRAAGVPDEVALVRDGVLVPLWDADGNAYSGWAPGPDFFSGTTFTIPDMTANPRKEHTWRVRTRTNGVVSAAGPAVTAEANTDSVWLLDPVTGARVEILGYEGLPAVEQATEEQAILHVPINAGLAAEPRRRRLLRTTKFGAVSGVVLDADEDVLQEWAEADSSNRYRLIFGKVNWSVIIGDYDPGEVFYGQNDRAPTRVLVEFNWWQRVGP